jgi:hypothetical protein
MLGLGTRALALGAAAVALGVDVIYLVAISAEDSPNDAGTVALVAGSIAAAAILALLAAARASGVQMVLLTASAAILVFWGILSLFSIGIPLLVGGFLAATAAVQAAERATPDAFRAAIAAAVGTVGALAIAYALS